MSLLSRLTATLFSPTTPVTILNKKLSQWKHTPDAASRPAPQLAWFQNIWDNAVPAPLKTADNATLFADRVRALKPDLESADYLPQKQALLDQIHSELTRRFNTQADTTRFPALTIENRVKNAFHFRALTENGIHIRTISEDAVKTPTDRAITANRTAKPDLESTIWLADAEGRYEKTILKTRVDARPLTLSLNDQGATTFPQEVIAFIPEHVEIDTTWFPNLYEKPAGAAFNQAVETSTSSPSNLTLWPLSFAAFTPAPDNQLKPEHDHKNALTDFPFFLSSARKPSL